MEQKHLRRARGDREALTLGSTKADFMHKRKALGELGSWQRVPMKESPWEKMDLHLRQAANFRSEYRAPPMEDYHSREELLSYPVVLTVVIGNFRGGFCGRDTDS